MRRQASLIFPTILMMATLCARGWGQDLDRFSDEHDEPAALRRFDAPGLVTHKLAAPGLPFPLYPVPLDLETLSERLQSAERRIQELESLEGTQERQAGHAQFGQTDLFGYELSDPEDSVTGRLLNLEDVFEGLKNVQQGFLLPGHSGATMKIVGRVHVDYWAFPNESSGVNAFETGDPATTPQDRLEFRRMRFGVRGTVRDNMEYRIEMEFAGGNRSEFRDAWLGFNDLPVFQTVRIGNQKRPYGLDHLNSSRFNVFIERPFIVEALNQDGSFPIPG